MLRLQIRRASLVVLAALAVSCSGGGAGSGTSDGVILDVQPRFAVRGRQAAQTIALRGDGTKWASESLDVDDISFGSGVEITRLAVANDRYIEVDVNVLADAAVGYRDIVVGSLPFAGIFRVADPFRVVGGTPIKAGRFFRAVVEGTETQWIDGVETSSPDDEVLVGGNYLSLGDVELRTDVISEHYLELTGYTHWYAFNGTGGDIDLLIGLGPEDERDLGVGVLEVEAEPRRQLLPNVVAQGVLDEDLATHVYEMVLPEFSYCGVYVYEDTTTSTNPPLMRYEIYHPGYPGKPWHKSIAADDDYVAGYYTFAAAPLYVVVHDLDQRGGGTFGYQIENDCDLLVPETLAPGGTLNGEIVEYERDNSAFYLAESPRWAINQFVVTPTAASPVDHSLYLFVEGPLDQNPDPIFANGSSASAETVQGTVGTRLRSMLSVYASGYGGPDSAFTVTRTETPMAGGPIHENLSPLDIPDSNTVVQSTITVSGEAPAASGMHVGLDIAHSSAVDLVIELVSPQGVTLNLTLNDHSGRDLITIFPEISLPSTGNLPALASAGDPNGTWTLRIRDAYGFDVGQLKGWALTFE